MTPLESVDAINAAFADVHAVIAQGGAPEERQLALLRCYGTSAQIQAEVFAGLQIAQGRIDDDVAVQAQAVVTEMTDMLLKHNTEFGLDFSEFTDATRTIIDVAFFNRLNEVLALAIQLPLGTA